VKTGSKTHSQNVPNTSSTRSERAELVSISTGGQENADDSTEQKSNAEAGITASKAAELCCCLLSHLQDRALLLFAHLNKLFTFNRQNSHST
jgi:hypothetical protein